MYIGMRGHDFDTDTISALSKKCNEYGVGGVQLVLMRSIKGFKKGEFTPEYAKSIGDELKENGVRIPILGCYINPSDANEETLKESMDYFIENLHYAKYLGAEMVGLETCNYKSAEYNDTEEAYQYLLKNMKVLVAEAEKLGVIVGIEGVNFHIINKPDKMKRLVDDLNSPNVRVIFDPVNYINDNNYEQQDDIINRHFDLLGDLTRLLHLKDFVLKDGKVTFENPCKGLLNKKLVFERLKEVYPDCTIILEETKEDKLPSAKAEIEEMLKSL